MRHPFISHNPVHHFGSSSQYVKWYEPGAVGELYINYLTPEHSHRMSGPSRTLGHVIHVPVSDEGGVRGQWEVQNFPLLSMGLE